MCEKYIFVESILTSIITESRSMCISNFDKFSQTSLQKGYPIFHSFFQQNVYWDLLCARKLIWGTTDISVNKREKKPSLPGGWAVSHIIKAICISSFANFHMASPTFLLHCWHFFFTRALCNIKEMLSVMYIFSSTLLPLSVF